MFPGRDSFTHAICIGSCYWLAVENCFHYDAKVIEIPTSASIAREIFF